MSKEDTSTKNDEKPAFNVRKYREKKYGNKHKVNAWKAKNDTKLKRQYFKMLKKTGVNTSDIKLMPLKKKENFKKIREDFKKRQIKAEKAAQKEEKQKIRLQKEEALRVYREKKTEKYKILSRKTSKGQPSMAGRMKLLYETIKNKCSED